MICGVIDLISNYIDLNEQFNNPNFSTEYNYFNINVVAKINVISTLFNLLKLNKPGFDMQLMRAGE